MYILWNLFWIIEKNRLTVQIEEVKVEKKVEKKAVVKVEVKKGDNR